HVLRMPRPGRLPLWIAEGRVEFDHAVGGLLHGLSNLLNAVRLVGGAVSADFRSAPRPALDRADHLDAYGGPVAQNVRDRLDRAAEIVVGLRQLIPAPQDRVDPYRLRRP